MNEATLSDGHMCSAQIVFSIFYKTPSMTLLVAQFFHASTYLPIKHDRVEGFYSLAGGWCEEAAEVEHNGWWDLI